MFGYVTVAKDGLSKEAQERYRAFYCGLCRQLRIRHGSLSRLTLSYDLTFLYLLLSSLYEPEETRGRECCAPHPFRAHSYIDNELAAYCADMNLLLAYHKCRDDWQDEGSFAGRQGAAALKKAYEKVKQAHGSKCNAVEECLAEIGRIEKNGVLEPDRLANLSGRMLGIVYRWREDEWADTLQHMGEGLGRFIYIMDAYDDLEKDCRKGRYNPLKDLSKQADYETLMLDSLRWMIGECAQEFETLPLVNDMEILRNILYAGCWTRYRMKHAQDKPLQKKQGRHKE
ncbi:MAG: hypothetical protein E7331_00880 [Clostridiales bacterium]|nr:hypothetical protein [Clostridiales bacterium]